MPLFTHFNAPRGTWEDSLTFHKPLADCDYDIVFTNRATYWSIEITKFHASSEKYIDLQLRE